MVMEESRCGIEIEDERSRWLGIVYFLVEIA